MRERLALIGDVHGNLAALTAVLDAVGAAGIAAGACTGDVVLRGAEPEACVAAIRALGWPWAAGNTDRKIVSGPPRPPEHPASKRVGSRSWTHRHLSQESRRHLRELPARVMLHHAGARIVVIHGGGEDGGPVIDRTTPAPTLADLARRLEADCVVSGHTHRPVIRRAADCLFVNPGSVGEGEGGDRRPSWAWLYAGASGLEASLERVPLPLATLRSHR